VVLFAQLWTALIEVPAVGVLAAAFLGWFAFHVFRRYCADGGSGDCKSFAHGVRLDEPVTVHEVARALPDIATLRDRCRALAILERILTSRGTVRYAFDSRWRHGVEMASMDNGAGDSFSIAFTPAGAFVRQAHNTALLRELVSTPTVLAP